jgi:hypothetical protein
MRLHALFPTLCYLAATIASGQTVPVRITAGATVAINKHVPASSREIYTVTALAGQTLLVNVVDGQAELQVLAQGDGQTKPLPSVKISVDPASPSDWMNVLSKPGTYQIAVRTSSKKTYDLAITLMDPRDPRLDPGLTPDKVSLDLGAFGGKAKLSLKPFDALFSEDLGDGLPARLSIENEKIEFWIASFEGLKKYKKMTRPAAEWNKGLERLEAALKPGGQAVPPGQLPPGEADAALSFGARVEVVENPSFRALRYIGQFAQDTGTPSNPLTYILWGIGRDGRYFIGMRTQIEHPLLSKPWAGMNEGPKLRALQAEAARRLSGASPESFKPSLTQLDAVARSLRLP